MTEAAAPAPERRARWTARGIVAVAAAGVFARGVPGPLLIWDDRRFLVDNIDVQEVSLESFSSIFGKVHFQAWHPLHLLAYWLDVPWFGPNGPAIHAVNLILWVLALFLVLEVLEQLGLPRFAAIVATIVYGVHTVQVEAVTWATGRKEIVTLIFASLAVLAHLRAYGDAAAASPRAARWAPWLSRLFFVLAAMAKTTVLPLPGVLFLADWLLRGVKPREALLRQVPSLLLAAGFAGLVIWIWRTHEMIRPDTGGASAGGVLTRVCAAITHYLATAVWPAETSPLYPVDRKGDFQTWMLAGPLVLLIALVAAWRAKARRLTFALLAFLVLLAPVMNIVPVYFQWQDRYLSLPLLPLAFGAGAGIEAIRGWLARTNRPAWIATALAALLIAPLAARTVQYQQAWSGDEALFRHAATTHPDAFYAWMFLCELRRDARDLDGAVRACRRAVEAAPDLKLPSAALLHTLAVRDEARQRLEGRQAQQFAARYTRVSDDPEALRLLAGDMLAAGYRESALMPLERSLVLSPIDDIRLENAARVQLSHGYAFLARFYLRQMTRPPRDAALRELLEFRDP